MPQTDHAIPADSNAEGFGVPTVAGAALERAAHYANRAEHWKRRAEVAFMTGFLSAAVLAVVARLFFGL